MGKTEAIESHIETPLYLDLLLENNGGSNKWEQIIALNRFNETYDLGYQDGYSAKSKADQFYLKHNLEFALSNVEKYVKHLHSSYSIEFLGMFVKICSLEEFSALIVVSPSDYFSEKMDKVYEELYTYLEAINDQDKKLDIVFTLDGDTINEDKLTANGFILQYTKKGTRET